MFLLVCLKFCLLSFSFENESCSGKNYANCISVLGNKAVKILCLCKFYVCALIEIVCCCVKLAVIE